MASYCINCGRRLAASEIADENAGGQCYDCARYYEEEDVDEDEPPSWLDERLTDDDRTWIRDRARNFPPVRLVISLLFAFGFLAFVLGLIGSIGGGISVADCEESIIRECDNATGEGLITFGIGAAVATFASVMLFGFAHLLDVNLESRERLEDIYFETMRRRER